MKKSLIINMKNTNSKETCNKFENYLPKDNSFERISTLNTIDYDYLYIVNFDTIKVDNLESVFNKHEEHFIVQTDSFSDTELENICIAYENSTYSFKRDKTYEPTKSNLSFTKENELIRNAKIVAESVSMCKTLINKPSNELTTNSFARFLNILANECNLDYSEVFKNELEKLNAGGILAVNKGSSEDAKVVILKYNGNPDSNNKYTLVGKGIVFDTGGYSLKSTANIQAMKSDMGGAATVAAVISAISKLNLKVNIETIIPITDNLINEDAYRPDDIIEFMNGITAEIISTDAEGRLILADSLVMASINNPKLIIDVATLTGAVEMALGNKTTGVFGNDLESINKIIRCSESVGEYAWHLPINDSHREQIKGKVATIKNAASPAGASTAAAFLEKFVADNNWVHLDIAGTSWNNDTGATGAMVRPLIKFFNEVEEK
ncbi:MAG: M17 family metallopeptidase [Bacilli bacterium]